MARLRSTFAPVIATVILTVSLAVARRLRLLVKRPSVVPSPVHLLPSPTADEFDRVDEAVEAVVPIGRAQERYARIICDCDCLPLLHEHPSPFIDITGTYDILHWRYNAHESSSETTMEWENERASTLSSL